VVDYLADYKLFSLGTKEGVATDFLEYVGLLERENRQDQAENKPAAIPINHGIAAGFWVCYRNGYLAAGRGK
jgi:hypothetical protein